MRDPYQVLGVPSTATDEEVKKAYRDLARKYHPDNYHDNPLADLAQERMKEINEAYEAVQSQRKAARAGGYSGGYGGYQAGYQTGYQSGGSRYQRIRMAISQGNLNLAEELLNAMTDHDAEWSFLKGAICYRRGWLDEARRYYQNAVNMDPDNQEYQRALDIAEGRSTAYRPEGYDNVTTGTCGNGDCLRLCGATLCCNAFGVPICFC
ncbi:J domain-containing protein [Vescimonas sp.]|jgi:molecular chaperone DnaJ|uniref:J domain-containing protein n=1 Tax=Vescimonas sp. TaxID=2892404 RepID=UPI000EC103B9|nr:molecular chaperone DnaJ [Oscillibacter sp.]